MKSCSVLVNSNAGVWLVEMSYSRFYSLVVKECFLLLLLCFGFSQSALSQDQDVFDKTRMHQVEIFTEDSVWFDSLQSYYNAALHGAKHRYTKNTVIIDGVCLQHVGLRFKGKYSNYGFPGKKKPFRLDFNEFLSNQEFQGLKKLNLHNHAGDPSFLREFMAYDLFTHLGIEVPQCSFAELYIDNVYWGCYLIVEEPNKPFLEKHFGNKSGNFIECVQTSPLSYRGEDINLYPEFDLKSGGQNAWDNLLELLQLVSKYYSYDFAHQLSAVFDLDQFYRVLAVDVLINNPDNYAANGRNFYLYDDLEAGKIRWLPWDYNLSFWAKDQEPFQKYGTTQFYQPLIYRIKENSTLSHGYYAAFCRLINEELSGYDFNQKSLEAFDLIKESVVQDSLKFYTIEQFLLNRTEAVTVSMLRNFQPKDIYLPGVASLYESRRFNLKKIIAAQGYDCGNIYKHDTELNCSLLPNPAANFITIYIKDIAAEETGRIDVAIINVSGKIVLTQSNDLSMGSTTIQLSSLPEGVYITRISYQEKNTVLKFIKI